MSNNDIDQKLDEIFVNILTKIQSKYLIFNRHIQIRIQKWVEKLLQYDQNTIWRKSRNNYISLLCEMVMNGKIQGIFLRMPPQKDIPNLTQSQYRKALLQIKCNTKPEHLISHEVSIKKIEQPHGDIGSEIVTPNCQTQRITRNEPQQNIANTKIRIKETNQLYKIKMKENPKKQLKIIQKIKYALFKNEALFKKDNQYSQIIVNLNQLIELSSKMGDGLESVEDSAELRVQQGIGANKANLFQFGSPRGMTQMQYFKAALQL